MVYYLVEGEHVMYPKGYIYLANKTGPPEWSTSRGMACKFKNQLAAMQRCNRLVAEGSVDLEKFTIRVVPDILPVEVWEDESE